MRWYVYHLVDPRDGSVFYVGKGTGRRIFAHEREARRGVTSDKCRRIREIWGAGLLVQRAIAERFDSESQALAFEANEIDRIGIKNLTNVSAGDGAVYGPGIMGFIVWVARTSEGFERDFTVDVAEPEPSMRGALWRMFSERGFVRLARMLVEEAIERRGICAVNRAFKPYGIDFTT